MNDLQKEIVEPQPYDGVRILDLTYHYGAYAGRLFADLGAEVIRVEPESGLPDRAGGGDRQACFTFWNSSKKSMVLDLDRPEGRAAFDRLADTASIILVERGGPLFAEVEALRAAHPRAVVTSVAPFGRTGPLADAPASDLVLQAAGGIAWMSGRIEEAPLSLPFEQAAMMASLYAATVTAIALVDAEATGEGHLIDVSVQECIAHSLQNALQVWDLEGRVSIRGGEGTRDASEDIFPCKDGFIFLASPLSLGNSWAQLVRLIDEQGHPSAKALKEECWSNREWRLTREARQDFHRHFTAFTADRTKDELVREAVARRIVLAPVTSVSGLFDDAQLKHRSFFTTQKGSDGRTFAFPGAPYRLSKPVWKIAPPPPLGGETATFSLKQG